MRGGRNPTQIANFYGNDFIPANPPDTKVEPITITVGETQLVEENIFSFTHTVEMPWMLPGIPPTNKKVRVPLVVIVGFENGKVNKEHIFWDQASVLYQIGVLDRNLNGMAQSVAGDECCDVLVHTRDPILSAPFPPPEEISAASSTSNA